MTFNPTGGELGGGGEGGWEERASSAPLGPSEGANWPKLAVNHRDAQQDLNLIS